MPVVRVLHTADLHLDTSFAGDALPPEIGNQCRTAQRDTLRAILDRAQSWPADAVLIAGDLIENARVTRETLTFLQQAFAAIAPIPVFIVPGNADPYTPEAPYALEPWPANVTIFRQGHWERHDLADAPLSLYGFACTGDGPARNPFVEFQPEQTDTVQLGLLYAAEESCIPLEHRVETVFHQAEIASCNLDYLALGYVHGALTLNENDSPVACYPGAPHDLGFDAKGSGQFLEVELEPGKAPVITPVPVTSLRFASHTLDISDCNNLNAVSEALESLLAELEAVSTVVVRLTFQGTVDWLFPETLPILRERFRDKVAWIEFRDDVDTGPWFTTVANPNTTAGAFAQRMAQEIQDAPDTDTRMKLLRARSLGMAAFRGESLPRESVGGTSP